MTARSPPSRPSHPVCGGRFLFQNFFVFNVKVDANWRRDAIVELLRQKGKVKARELAKRFHVTRQTICQDITVLSLHCDIYTERGQNGGIYLLEKKRPIRKSLSSSQIQVLEQLLPSLSEEKRLIIQSILHDFGS